MVQEPFMLETHDDVDKALDKQMQRQYRNYRHKLHIQHFKPYCFLKEAIMHPPPGIEVSSWKSLCEYFDSDDFKKLSSRNQKNRGHVKFHHIAGSKSFMRIIHGKKLESGNEPQPSEFLRETCWSAKQNKWVIEEGAERYEKIMTEIAQADVDGSNQTEKDIVSNFLGPSYHWADTKKGRISTKRQHRIELEATRRRAEQADQRAEQAELRAEQLALEVQEIKASQRETNEMLKILISQRNSDTTKSANAIPSELVSTLLAKMLA